MFTGFSWLFHALNGLFRPETNPFHAFYRPLAGRIGDLPHRRAYRGHLGDPPMPLDHRLAGPVCCDTQQSEEDPMEIHRFPPFSGPFGLIFTGFHSLFFEVRSNFDRISIEFPPERRDQEGTGHALHREGFRRRGAPLFQVDRSAVVLFAEAFFIGIHRDSKPKP